MANPGFTTKLSPWDELGFRLWVQSNQVPWNDHPSSDYDMRGFYQGIKDGDPIAVQAPNGHYPDKWKTPYHATFSDESIYATPDAPSWQKTTQGQWQLVSNDGKVITTEP